MKTVYIVGFESNSNSISFWDWYPTKQFQYDRLMELTSLRGNEKLSGVLYYGEVELENVDDIEDINGLVELWLEENDWENAFPENTNIILN